MKTHTSTRSLHRAQSVRWAHAPARAFLVARAYCTVCGWEEVATCRVPRDVRVVGLDQGPRRQVDPCECGGAVYVDLSRG